MLLRLVHKFCSNVLTVNFYGVSKHFLKNMLGPVFAGFRYIIYCYAAGAGSSRRISSKSGVHRTFSKMLRLTNGFWQYTPSLGGRVPRGVRHYCWASPGPQLRLRLSMLRCWAEVPERQVFEISVYIMLLYMQYFTGTVQYVQCSTVRTVLTVQYSTYSAVLYLQNVQYSTVLCYW